MEIRPYRPEDLPEVEKICIATGLGGNLQEHFCDEEIFVKLWLGAFLTLAPQDCLVGIKNGLIVAYLVCTYDDRFNRKALGVLWPTVVKLLWRWMLGRYRSHPPTTRFIRWLLLRSWRETPKIPHPSAHFHFNIIESEKEGMPGFKLGKMFIAEARRRGKPQYHATVFARPGRKDRRFYERLGFDIFDSKPCSLFGEGSEMLTVRKILGPESTGPID